MVMDETASQLCAACGICCDGTLYPTFESEDKDQPGLLSGRLGQVAQKAGKVTWSQPCQAYKGGVCSIYVDRPAVCRRYQCTTLEALKAGRISREQAERNVDQAMQAQGKLEDLLGPGGASSSNRLRALRKKGTRPEVLLAIGVLEIILDRHFRNSSERTFSGGRRSMPMNFDSRRN